MHDLPRGAAAINRLALDALKRTTDPRNERKGHWGDLSRRRLTWLFLVEVWELLCALWVLRREIRRLNRIPFHEFRSRADQRNRCTDAADAVRHELADCTAYLAFIGDRI